MDVRYLATLFMLLSTFSAYASQGLYFNGRWDEACSHCWPSPRTLSNHHCKPTDCAIQGYYHCQPQNPPLAADDDPRLISFIKSGQCQYVPHEAFNAGEAAYVNKVKRCTEVLDKMAGRFVMPPYSQGKARGKMDFYLTRFKAMILGSTPATFKLAMDYDFGVGTQQDRLRATALYHQAASQGFPLAQYALGARYAYGIAMPMDKEKAIAWLNKALANQSTASDDKEMQSLVAPCALRLLERLTLL